MAEVRDGGIMTSSSGPPPHPTSPHDESTPHTSKKTRVVTETLAAARRCSDTGREDFLMGLTLFDDS